MSGVEDEKWSEGCGGGAARWVVEEILIAWFRGECTVQLHEQDMVVMFCSCGIEGIFGEDSSLGKSIVELTSVNVTGDCYRLLL